MASRSTPKPPSDEVLSTLANEQHLKFAALAPHSHLVKLVIDTMAHIPGLTPKSMLPSLVTAADVFLGPIEFSFVTEVDSKGEIVNTGKNVSASFMANVAPTGSAKTFLMNLGPVGLGAATSAVRRSRYAGLRSLVDHIPLCKDGAPIVESGCASWIYRHLQLTAHAYICRWHCEAHDERRAGARRALQPSPFRCSGHSLAGTGGDLCVSLLPH
jgi:hypothetical protein